MTPVISISINVKFQLTVPIYCWNYFSLPDLNHSQKNPGATFLQINGKKLRQTLRKQ